MNEVVKKARLSKLPILTHFERNAGAYITCPVISARSSDGKIENVSKHRLQVLDDTQPLSKPREKFELAKIPVSKSTMDVINEMKKASKK